MADFVVVRSFGRFNYAPSLMPSSDVRHELRFVYALVQRKTN